LSRAVAGGDDASAEALRRKLEASMRPIVTGRGRAEAGEAQPQVAPTAAGVPAGEIVLPPTPPAWANEQMQAGASAGKKSSALKTARAAESAAAAALRDRIGRLAWDNGTIADRLPQDRAMADAIDRAVASARITHVNYLADGSVQVSLSLDGRRLWNELSRDGARAPE
jgi:hypothetical protein